MGALVVPVGSNQENGWEQLALLLPHVKRGDTVLTPSWGAARGNLCRILAGVR